MGRVRVVLEGERGEDWGGIGFKLEAGGGGVRSYLDNDHIVSIEDIDNRPTFDDLPVGTVFSVDGVEHKRVKVSDDDLFILSKQHRTTYPVDSGRTRVHRDSKVNIHEV